jgi:hypothetical protein
MPPSPIPMSWSRRSGRCGLSLAAWPDRPQVTGWFSVALARVGNAGHMTVSGCPWRGGRTSFAIIRPGRERLWPRPLTLNWPTTTISASAISQFSQVRAYFAGTTRNPAGQAPDDYFSAVPGDYPPRRRLRRPRPPARRRLKPDTSVHKLATKDRRVMDLAIPAPVSPSMRLRSITVRAVSWPGFLSVFLA